MSLVQVASSTATGAKAAAEIAGKLGDDVHVVFLFASIDCDVAAICSALQKRYASAPVVGCSTMGEVGPAGFTTGAVAAIGFGGSVRGSAVLIEDLSSFRFDEATDLLARLEAGVGSAARPETHVLVTMTDGLCGLEEVLVSSLALAAPGLGLVGGSAADDFRLDHTVIAHGDRSSTKGAVVVLLEPGVPFEVFKAQHYVPTAKRLVVTEADPERRQVLELDGRPCAEVLAEALGVSEAELEDVAPRQAVFGFGAKEHGFLRSVLTLRDGVLFMGGAVERGAVLTLMKGEGLVERTREGLDIAIQALPTELAGELLFQCGGRQMEAVKAGCTDELYDAMVRAPSAGFVTYGEQFGAQQVNHTLTGLVLGHPDV